MHRNHVQMMGSTNTEDESFAQLDYFKSTRPPDASVPFTLFQSLHGLGTAFDGHHASDTCLACACPDRDTCPWAIREHQQCSATYQHLQPPSSALYHLYNSFWRAAGAFQMSYGVEPHSDVAP